MILLSLAIVTPELSVDQLLVGTGGLGVVAFVAKMFLNHLGRVEDRHEKSNQVAQDNFREDIRAMRAEHLAERQETMLAFKAERDVTQAEYRLSLKEVVDELHPRLDKLEAGQEDANRKLGDIGGHLASMHRTKP